MLASVIPPMAIDAALPDRSLTPLIGENCWNIYGGLGVRNVSQIYRPGDPTYFKVGEDMATIQRSGEWFIHPGQPAVPWTQEVLAGQYAATVLRGLNWILNVPAGTDGQLPTAYVNAAEALGNATRGLHGRIVASLPFTDVQCPGTVDFSLGATSATFNAVVLREDLAKTGQVVANYSLSVDGTTLPPASIPGPAFDQWNISAGTSIGFGVMDLVGREVDGMLRGRHLSVVLTGCLATRARIAVEARSVDLGPLAPSGS